MNPFWLGVSVNQRTVDIQFRQVQHVPVSILASWHDPGNNVGQVDIVGDARQVFGLPDLHIGVLTNTLHDEYMDGLGDPEIKDFGTSFRISLHRKPFETDPFGVVIPSKEAENEVQHQSSASNDAEHDAKETSSASPDAQKQAIDALLASLPEKNRARASRILDCMIRNPHSTAVQIGKEIGLSKATVQRAIDGMKAADIVARQGSNNGGQWLIHTVRMPAS